MVSEISGCSQCGQFIFSAPSGVRVEGPGAYPARAWNTACDAHASCPAVWAARKRTTSSPSTQRISMRVTVKDDCWADSLHKGALTTRAVRVLAKIKWPVSAVVAG
jgi:hypothetical protein